MTENISGPVLTASLDDLKYLVFQGMKGDPGEPGSGDIVLLRADANGWVYNGETAITGAQINTLAGNGKPLLLWDEDDERLFTYAGHEGDDALFIMPAVNGNGAYVKIVEAERNASSWYERSVGSLPRVAASDSGKFLRVVNGAWAAQTVPAAESDSFGGGS